MIYLLHFDKPFKHARHYLGYTRSLKMRLQYHDSGRGSRLMAAVAAAGISYVVTRRWKDGDRNFERKLHNGNNNPKLCPICVRAKKLKAPAQVGAGPTAGAQDAIVDRGVDATNGHAAANAGEVGSAQRVE